ncbi:uncharacterized protein TRAVEDRAFT_49825 [Trametes versicolor FP-101664 SS1]|uniref:uncharacterized protein n=1 Tax=Trametes versicolor (strain FP-101664) TaxID=717944 RepID=UPI0004624A06|nr:uncharacterized protein TRAVEDRAFT_49825 [Trametes versicolor FP-101664 SS1]EIW57016.1 hypothetical protein TRAVEDRAFT_49825 [Trametes versicolor FP-101664 SS1]
MPPLLLHRHSQEKPCPGSGTQQKRRFLERRGQTGRFIIALLATDDVPTTKSDERTTLFISERTVYPQEELYNMKTFVYDSPEDDAIVQAMYMIDSRLLLRPTGRGLVSTNRNLLLEPEVAEAASQTLDTQIEFECIERELEDTINSEHVENIDEANILVAPKRTSNGKSKPAGTQQSKSSRKILITAGEGPTGRLIIELLTTDDVYVNKYGELTALVFSEQANSVLEEFETVKTVVYDPKDEGALVDAMSLVDTCLLIPPARKARLRATLARHPKGDTSSADTGYSPCLTRTGFYAENLLLYSKQALGKGKLPLPIGEDHNFAPVALGDVAQMTAYVVTSDGPHGLANDVRDQVIVATGPQLTAGPELPQAASQALGTKMEFESIHEDTMKKILSSEQGEEVDEAKLEYLLEYYALVRAGKTNYVATTAMLAFLGHRGQEPTEFFKTYSAEFKPKKPRTTKTGGAEIASKSVPTRVSGRGEGAAPGVKSAGHDDIEIKREMLLVFSLPLTITHVPLGETWAKDGQHAR